MALREMQIGKGTIAYKGESAEYHAGKRGLWQRVGRPAFIAVLAIVGVLFVYASFTSAAVGTVTAFAPGQLANKASVGVVLPDGATGQVLVPDGATFVAGDRITVSVLPLGRMVYGNDEQQARYVGIAFLLGAGAMLTWGIRQDRRRRTDGREVDGHDVDGHDGVGHRTEGEL
jgi:hypothetical protein